MALLGSHEGIRVQVEFVIIWKVTQIYIDLIELFQYIIDNFFEVYLVVF